MSLGFLHRCGGETEGPEGEACRTFRQDRVAGPRIKASMAGKSGSPRAPHTPAVFTVGYEGRTVDELLALLTKHRIQVLVDVRLNAISRRRGFSKTSLSGSLAEAGIDYVHEPGLGNPKDNRPAFRDGKPAAQRRYLKHVQQHGSDAVERVSALVESAPTALLCVEREPASCHRTAIASELGLPVVSL